MTTEIIPPSQIQSELTRIWDSLEGTNKMRASLFNLIFFTKKKTRSQYIRDISQKVIEKFPSRVIFITADPDAGEDYLHTRVSVLSCCQLYTLFPLREKGSCMAIFSHPEDHKVKGASLEMDLDLGIIVGGILLDLVLGHNPEDLPLGDGHVGKAGIHGHLVVALFIVGGNAPLIAPKEHTFPHSRRKKRLLFLLR